MQRVNYELDPFNRLVIKNKPTGIAKFRRVLDGYFKVSKGNSLAYHIKAPYPADIKAPYQLKLKGNWALGKNHDLVFTLDKSARQTFGQQLIIKGEIIDVSENALLFAVTTRSNNAASTYLLELGGSWQADKNNRLTFSVKKGINRQDALTFDGEWEVNKNHHIIYKYEKYQLIRKRREAHTLTFKGYWDIRNKAKISYVLNNGINSVFDFGVSLGIFKENYIKYELSILTSRKKNPSRRVVILPGMWRINKKLGLLFEVEYEEKGMPAITLGAEAKLSDKDEILFKLKDYLNRAIGAELKLSHRIIKGDGELFLRLFKSKEERALIAGAGFRW